MQQQYGLTTRELEIIELRVRGYSFDAIAQHLHLSEQTVRNHLRNARAKIGVSNLQEIIMRLYNLELKPEFEALLQDL